MTGTGPHEVILDEWISCAPYEKYLNISILSAENGEAILSMPFKFEMAQGAGIMHGGALVSLADTAAVMAIKSILPPQTHFATISLQTRFHHPVLQGKVEAHAVAELQDEPRLYQAKVSVYAENRTCVMEMHSVFKVARKAKIDQERFKSA